MATNEQASPDAPSGCPAVAPETSQSDALEPNHLQSIEADVSRPMPLRAESFLTHRADGPR